MKIINNDATKASLKKHIEKFNEFQQHVQPYGKEPIWESMSLKIVLRSTHVCSNGLRQGLQMLYRK